VEVNCEVTSRAVKSAALTGRAERKAHERVGKDTGAPKEDLSAVRLPMKGYKIVAKLGQGGMASVYLVECDADGLQLALKLLDTRGTDTDSLLERFIQEFEVISAICHPNVAAIYDRGVTDEGLFILMEYFERGDLKRRVRKGMTSQQALAALNQVATGLPEIHQRGVVHQDMKPENVLLRADRTLPVADFGIAKAHAGGVASTAVGRAHGHAALCEPGTGQRQSCRRAQRSVQLGRDLLRDADRAASVPRGPAISCSRSMSTKRCPSFPKTSPCIRV
jgi:serine/threonine protein kinase